MEAEEEVVGEAAAAPPGEAATAAPQEGELPEGAEVAGEVETGGGPEEISPPPKSEAEEEAAPVDGEEPEGAGESPEAEGAGESTEGEGAVDTPSAVPAVGEEVGEDVEEVGEVGSAGDAAAAAAPPEEEKKDEEGTLPPPPPPPQRRAESVGEVLPTNASFEAGAPREPRTLQVSEDLSRSLSMSLWELEARSSPGRLVPGGSPESQEGEEEESAEAVEARLAEERRQRVELVEHYRQLTAERGRLRQHSTLLQGRLAEALNKAKGKDRARAELEQHISDKEQRYSRYLAMLQELRSQQREEMAWYQQQVDALQCTCQEKLAKVGAQWKAYQVAKKEIAVYTMGRRLGGRQAAIRQVDQIQCKEESKEREVTEVSVRKACGLGVPGQTPAYFCCSKLMQLLWTI